MSDQRICPRSPLVGGDCKRECYHSEPHERIGDCEAIGPVCSEVCIPAKPAHSPDCAVAVNWRPAGACGAEDTPITDAADLYDYQTEVETCGKLERDLQAARETITAINRRCQQAESLIAKTGIVDGRPQVEVGRSVGRALANYAAATYKRERDSARAELSGASEEIEALRHAVRENSREVVKARAEVERLRRAMQSLCDRCRHLAPSGACRTFPIPGRPCNEFSTANARIEPLLTREKGLTP